jgi:hypothetical protein
VPNDLHALGLNPHRAIGATLRCMGAKEASTEADLSAIVPSGTAGLFGGWVIITGGLTVLLGVQTLDILRGALPLCVGASLLLLGAPNVYLGWNVRKGRGWAAQWAFVLGALAAVAALAWAVLLILAGFFSLLACLLVPINGLGAAAAFAQIVPGKAADAARLRLAEQGLDFGA